MNVVNFFRDLFGFFGTVFGLWSLILQLLDRNKIEPRIQQVIVRITDTGDFLIQATIANLGNKITEGCMATIFEEDNSLRTLAFFPIDSPIGRISPDWPSNAVFQIQPRTQINVRGYLPSSLAGHRIHVRLTHNNSEVDQSNTFSLPHLIRQVRPVHVAPIPVTPIPQPSYPPDEWEFIWCRYSGNNTNPWASSIITSTKSDVDFDEDWSDNEVNDTGQYDLVGFIASRFITLDETGKYRFKIGGDDGIRLYFYDKDMIEIFRIDESWKDQSYTEYAHDENLSSGEYNILLEWYENTGAARASFSLEKIEERPKEKIITAPKIEYRLTQAITPERKRQFPDVGFNVFNHDESTIYVIRVFVQMILGGKPIGLINADYYNGTKPWTLNPARGVIGHFEVPEQVINSKERFEVKVKVIVEQPEENRFEFAEVGWVYRRQYNDWYFEP